jgi:Fe2+ transport system protein B
MLRKIDECHNNYKCQKTFVKQIFTIIIKLTNMIFIFDKTEKNKYWKIKKSTNGKIESSQKPLKGLQNRNCTQASFSHGLHPS